MKQLSMTTFGNFGRGPRIIALSVGLILIATSAIILKTLLPSRSFKATSQPQLPAPQQITSTPIGSQNATIASWKTYRNEQLGFSFNYPPDWKIKPYTKDAGDQEGLSNIVLDITLGNNGHENGFALYYYSNPQQLSLQAFEQKRKQIEKYDVIPPLYSPNDEPRLLSNGLRAYYRENVICEPVECQIYIMPFKDKVFVFYNSQYNQVPNQNQIFDQIFSTFKFTK